MTVQQALYSLSISPACLAPARGNVQVIAVGWRGGTDWEATVTAPAFSPCSLAVVGVGEEGYRNEVTTDTHQ